MAKYIAWIRTNKVGSECEWEFEVDDIDLDGASEDEVEELCHDAAREALVNVHEWGWRKADED